MLHWGIFLPHHFLAVWRSEPPFIQCLRHLKSSCHTINSMFRATSPILAFRATIVSQFWRSKPSLPSLTFRVTFPISVFRAIITSSFDVQSHRYHFSVSAFRAIIVVFQFRRSEPSSVFSLTFRFAFLSLTFTVAFSVFNFQSHHHLLVLAFKAIIVFSG